MELRFKLNYLFQGQNSPFLHAVDAGYFGDHGLSCTFVEGFSSSLVTRALAGSEADIGFGDVSSVFERALRAGETEISCLVPIYEHTPCCLGYISDGKCLTLADVPGSTLCGPNGDTSARLLPLLLKRNGFAPDSYTYLGVQPEERDRLVASRSVLAATCFDATLKFAMQMRGYDASALDFLYFADNGLDTYSGALVALNSVLEQEPNLAGKLQTITRQAWRDCLANPQLGVEAVIRRSPDMDPDIVRNQLSWILQRQVFPTGDRPMTFELDGTKMADTLECATYTVGTEAKRSADGLAAEICRN
ncbi:ABC transporter substrate-binding protein [Aminobacter aganoensis]|uniref:Thiamine pyrimidine synthase n=1 Tax=Aminobacter aganoensis TaxID=83264 RepID=A0A7X0F749_9HYPH|nr:ABC transporter substrate-binding protein [Aminobacter aganoensis]MBB6354397.1 ABC-type nitrate/sulfonate/bicarbonate transport system substrate-binding protein [Aminobacter aganoensis]